MVTETNDDYYCPRCGISDNLQQTVTTISVNQLAFKTKSSIVSIEQLLEFNCGVCKFKSIIGVTNE